MGEDFKKTRKRLIVIPKKSDFAKSLFIKNLHFKCYINFKQQSSKIYCLHMMTMTTFKEPVKCLGFFNL